MFTGDHVLFDITPNITAWIQMKDALGTYLDSLRKIDAYDVRLALPGHRKTGDFHQRIAQLLEHHHRRLDEALSVVKAHPGRPAYDIAGHMTWKIRANSWQDFPVAQKWFAVGECMSHLDYLTAICALKQVLSVRETRDLLQVGSQDREPEDLYAAFYQELSLAQDCTAEVLDPTLSREELPRLALRLALRSYADKLACQRVLSLLVPKEEKAERKKK